jgi:hypothetical protein
MTVSIIFDQIRGDRVSRRLEAWPGLVCLTQLGNIGGT